MNILFTRFPLESSYGGAEVQTLSLIRELQHRGHTVSFLGSCPVLLSENEKLKIENSKLDISPPPVTKWGAISFVWRQHAMRKNLHSQLSTLNSQLHFDAVCMLSLSEKILLTPIAIQLGIKVIWIEHDRVGNWLTKNPWLKDLKRMSKDVTTVVVSDRSKKIYNDLGFQDVIAIPNGIDITPYVHNDKLNARRPTPDALTIGCVTRLTADKGIDLLIQAVADLPQASLTIVGKGREEGYLRKLIEEIGLTIKQSNNQNRITLTPWIDDLPAFYRSIDCLVLPSRQHDPFGLVAAEAMAAGTPVIVTDQCGIADYLTDGQDAIIAEANSAPALSKAIDKVLDPDVRSKLSSNGRATALEKFSLERMVDRYEALLR